YVSMASGLGKDVESETGRGLKMLKDETVSKILASAQPTLFIPNYTRACGKPPCVMPITEDLSDSVDAGTVMKFPSDADAELMLDGTGRRPDQHYYTCNIEGFRFPGLRRNNTLSNKDLWPLIPSCFSINQLDKKSVYTDYLENPAEAKADKMRRQIAREGRVVGPDKTLASNSRYGRLPQVFAKLLFYVDSDHSECLERGSSMEYLLRRGTSAGPDSLLECVALGVGVLSGRETPDQLSRVLRGVREKMAGDARFCLSANVQRITRRAARAALLDESVVISADLFLRAVEVYFGCRVVFTSTCPGSSGESCGLRVGLPVKRGSLPLKWSFREGERVFIVHSVRGKTDHYSLLYRTRCADSGVRVAESAAFPYDSSEVRTLGEYAENMRSVTIPSVGKGKYTGTVWPQILDALEDADPGSASQTVDGAKCARSVTVNGVTVRFSPIPPLSCRITAEPQTRTFGTRELADKLAEGTGEGANFARISETRVPSVAPSAERVANRLHDYQRLKHLSRCLKAYTLFAFTELLMKGESVLGISRMENYLSLESREQWDIADNFVGQFVEVVPGAYADAEKRISRHISFPFRDQKGFSEGGKLLVPDVSSRESLVYAVWMETRATPWRLFALHYVKRVPDYYRDFWVWKNSRVSLSVPPGPVSFHTAVQEAVVEFSTKAYYVNLLPVEKGGASVCLVGAERSSAAEALEDVRTFQTERKLQISSDAEQILQKMEADSSTGLARAAEESGRGLAVQSYISEFSMPLVFSSSAYVRGGLRLLTYMPSNPRGCRKRKHSRAQKWVAVLWEESA
ncbi:hypothetical protein JKY79_02270, partial [Candidatus Babeliales bacterium]|nr:hypothetical protein [Candidatus Babeliales bacterium]